MLGLRGVGKTVLLDRMRDDAESAGIHTMFAEAPEDKSLPALMAPPLRQALLRISKHARARNLARRALGGLASFVNSMKVKYRDIEVGLDLDPEPGLADDGDLEQDLLALLLAVAAAAQAAGTALVMLMDELQYVKEKELGALITALHHIGQRSLPVTIVGAGLPQIREHMGRAKSYAERLFDFVVVGALDPDAAGAAVSKPVVAQKIKIEGEAVVQIVNQTGGYPYFLQEWGKHTWNVALGSTITCDDVKVASGLAVAALDEGFFRVRFDRLTPAERRYLRAMAALGPGPHRSGDIAGELDRKVTSLGPTRSQLIAKGMVWSPGHGETAFTVPLFDQFMCRMMHNDDWRDA